MSEFSSKYKRSRKTLQITLWILLLIVIFLIFGFVVIWAVNPASNDFIREMLGIEATPTPSPTPLPTATPLPTPTETPTPTPAPGVIVIDPGRGGEEKTPITNADGSIYEKDVNLEIALLLKENLELHGYVVVMTRTEDVEVSQSERAQIANEANADLFISLHLNNLASDTSVNGIDILYGTDRSDSKNLANYLITPIIKNTSAKNRGVKASSSYTVLNKVEIPSVLIEMGFISCPDEMEKLMKFTYRDTMVQGIISGITSYMESIK